MIRDSDKPLKQLSVGIQVKSRRRKIPFLDLLFNGFQLASSRPAPRQPPVRSGFGARSIGAAERVPEVLQTGGHTITNHTRKALDLTKDQAKRAMEGLKKELGQGNSHHQHKILDNGDVLDSHNGEWLGNLYDYLF